ncbi:hypothetical protein TWF696_006977 [Orbilia brochopaga]|uniref:Uncharacterized protein n=1 Tax=Orbilia brochopaga TaxID=3140254 RepID=A0AAV9UQH0_9PEZI
MVNTTDTLPLLPNLFQLNASQWQQSADAEWYERDAVGGAPDIIETLANVEFIANHIDDDPNSPTFGWQNSNVYRDDPPAGGNTNNARLMEPISTLSWAYVVNKPWNPYFHNSILLQRLIAALNYWLGLQTSQGGFSEVGGPGTQHLAPTAFSLNFLVEMMDELDKDGTMDAAVRTRLRNAVFKATELAATNQQFRNWGFDASNQYTPIFYVLWRLWQITNDTKWKNLYDARLDEWLATVQKCPFYVERASPEAFGYSHVTEWVLDRTFALNNDPRLLQSLRRYYDWCSLNTVPENDGQMFITDVAGNGRTSLSWTFGEVGYYNYITQYVPASQAFSVGFAMTASERQQRMSSWAQSPIPPTGRYPGVVRAYHIFHNYPMFFSPHGLWTVTPRQQQAAVRQLPPVAQSKFTRYWGPPRAGVASYLFVRRTNVYVTLHFGARATSHQAKEVGLVWIPGFGTVIRGWNANINYAFCTVMGDKTTFKRTISDFELPAGWASSTSADGSVASPDELRFASTFGNIGILKRYRINNSGFELVVTPNAAATEQIPLYLDKTDVLKVDGQIHDLRGMATASTVSGRGLRITRTRGGRTTTVSIGFNQVIQAQLTYGYELAYGDVFVLSVSIQAGATLGYQVKLAA